MKRLLVSLVVLVVACTGGGGTLDGNGGGTSSGGSSGGSSGSSGGTTGEVRASDFSQSCSTDDDCVVIYEGAICNACGCANAAITRTAQSDYVAKRQAANCPTTDVECANDCITVLATCSNGKCAVTNSGLEETDAGN